MLHDVDESLRAVIARDALNGTGAELSFDAPTKDWAATVDLYLYDIREDLDRRHVAYERVLNDEGRTVGRRPPPRRFGLSYLVTAWTQRPEDEHQLLSRMLTCFLRYEALPQDVLQGALKDQALPVLVKIALPPAEDRSISDLWTALGGELKPSLDLIITAPFDPGRDETAGPPVLEQPRVVLPGAGEDAGRARPRRGGGRRGRAAAEAPAKPPAEAPPVEEDTVQAGADSQPGRILRVRPLRRPQRE